MKPLTAEGAGHLLSVITSAATLHYAPHHSHVGKKDLDSQELGYHVECVK